MVLVNSNLELDLVSKLLQVRLFGDKNLDLKSCLIGFKGTYELAIAGCEFLKMFGFAYDFHTAMALRRFYR